MRARKHRGSFSESMATMRGIPATMQAVAEFFELPKKSIVLIYYGFDYRKGWNANTWLVKGDQGVYGMIDQEVRA
jgi:hypothetical protein